MKKILFFSLLIIIIPYLIINTFIRNEEIKFIYTSNMNVRVKNTQTEIISNIPFEDYIIGVVAGEMPSEFDIEALKAQAVAARSYVMKQMVYNKDKDYDVVDSVINQVYLDNNKLKSVWKDEYIEKINKIKSAVSKTYNEYLEYEGKVIDAMFFSTSVGYTENSEEVFTNKVPYLRSVESKWDEISPVYELNYHFSLNDFCNKLDIECNNLKIDIIDSTSTGRIKKIKINDKEFKGNDVQKLLGLKSNYFKINYDDEVTISTKGYGHGVGMSQYGAQGMALKGYNYKDILSYYYQGTDLKKI